MWSREFWFDEHFEGETLLHETITVHLMQSGGKVTVWYGLQTEVGSGNATKRVALSADGGRVHVEIPLGFKESLEDPPRAGLPRPPAAGGDSVEHVTTWRGVTDAMSMADAWCCGPAKAARWNVPRTGTGVAGAGPPVPIRCREWARTNRPVDGTPPKFGMSLVAVRLRPRP